MNEEIEVVATSIQQLCNQNNNVIAVGVIKRLIVDQYKKGYSDAVRNYATWNDGEQFVGATRRPLKTVLDEINLQKKIPIVY